jgi:hypothetical protein
MILGTFSYQILALAYRSQISNHPGPGIQDQKQALQMTDEKNPSGNHRQRGSPPNDAQATIEDASDHDVEEQADYEGHVPAEVCDQRASRLLRIFCQSVIATQENAPDRPLKLVEVGRLKNSHAPKELPEAWLGISIH